MRGLLLAVAVAAGAFLTRPAEAQGLLIIANPSVDVRAPLGVGVIAAIYLLRITNWPDGTHIVPVNREATSAARARFVDAVLGEDDAGLSAYWSEMHFKGREPPVVQESERSMLAFVRNVPGAIGYVSDATSPVGVRVLAHVR
jgi:ABC-type phosphate transport system substrate-binding protein